MWTSAGSVVNRYVVEWRYNGECSDVSGGRATVGGSMTSYTLVGLEEYITYAITVTASNDVSSAVSQIATAQTSPAGKPNPSCSQVTDLCPTFTLNFFHSLQLHLVLPLQLVPTAHPPASLSSGDQ